MKEKIVIAALFFLAIIPLLNMFQKGLPVTHDGQDHVARIANFYTSLSEGNVVPRWAENLNWGFGHPILMFLYPLPSYMASLFHELGFSLTDATKLVFAVSYIVSILAMYAWARMNWGVLPGFVSAILYGFAPYRFVDLYVRGALGEHVAFMFPPLIFLGLYGITTLAQSTRWGMLLALSIAGLLLSHNAVSIMVLPLMLIYALYLCRSTSCTFRRMMFSFFAVLLGFMISFFFWFPAYAEGRYTLRDIVTGSEVLKRMVPWERFFYSPWSYGGTDELSKDIGITQWVLVGMGIWLAYKMKTINARKYIVGILIIFGLTVLMMTSVSSPVWSSISVLQKFQFPWRLLTICVIATSTIGGLVCSLINKRNVLKFSLIVTTMAVVSTAHMWQPKAYNVYSDSFFTDIYEGTTDTGESSPIWSTRFMEHRFSAPLEVIEGTVSVKPTTRTSTRHSYIVQAEGRARLVENTLYFPGWRVAVDSVPTMIEFQDPRYRGLMTFWVEKGNRVVDIQFEETKLRKYSNYVSIAGIILFVAAAYYFKDKKV